MSATERIVTAWVDKARAAHDDYRECAGWPNPAAFDTGGYRTTAEADARRFAAELLTLRSLDAEDEPEMAVELAWTVAEFIGDPHDWQEARTVAALLDWYWKTVQRRG